MKTPYRIRGTGLLGLSSLLCFAVVRAHADPLPLAPPTHPPLPTNPPAPAQNPLAPPTDKAPHLLTNLTLDYEGATQNSAEVLNSKVTVAFKDASFLSALDAVMNASAKTCRIECRQLSPLRLSMKVTDTAVASLLDSLAKLSGARLFVLPSKLILAPESALTDDEKRKAKLYGVLLTATTLPDTPDVKALAKKDGKNVSILDIVNAKFSLNIKKPKLPPIKSAPRNGSGKAQKRNFPLPNSKKQPFPPVFRSLFGQTDYLTL